MKHPSKLTFAACGLGLLLAGCNRKADFSNDDRPIGSPIEIKAPLGLPPVPIPVTNFPTAETVALGRKLFYETKLSSDNSLSCASCHNPLIAFCDGRKSSSGVGGKLGLRNAPSVVNSAYSSAQFWDGRALNLEDQAGGPMANPTEMNQPHEISLSRLAADAWYRANFEKAFGPGKMTIGRVTNAIASFERTLVSGNSPFDRYVFGRDKGALSEAAIRGLAIFRDDKRGNCVTCHTIGAKDALFTDGKFHNIGVGVDDNGELIDLGRYKETRIETDKGAFKTPMLREVAKTGPYMHDGSLRTLRDVVDFYAGGGNSNAYLDKEIKTIKLSGKERSDLVAFLEALTGEMPANSGPPETAGVRQYK